MRFRLRAALAGVTVLAMMGLAACGGGSPNEPGTAPDGGAEAEATADATPKTLTLGLMVDTNSFDPGELDTGLYVALWQPVYDTLLRYSPTGEILPGMATGYEYSDDKLELTLHLRDDIVFSDGEAFTGEVVKLNMEHLAESTGVSSYMVNLVESIEVVSDYEVTVHLSEPDPAFTYYLCLVAGAMASPAAVGTAEIKDVPVGSGPYVLDVDSTIRGSQYTFVRNPDYIEPEDFPFDTYTVKVLEDLTARMNALKSGQIDGAFVDPTVIAEAEASNLQVLRNPISWQGLVLFGRTGGTTEALHDLRVRQALNYAIDSETILKEIYKGAGVTSTQIFEANSPAHVAELNDRYPYDPEKARELLAEAGYTDSITLHLPQYPGQEVVVPALTQQLGEVGITVEWTQSAFEPSAMAQGEWDVALFGSSSGHPWRDIHKMVTVGGTWNPMGSEDPELNDLIAKIKMSDGEEQVGYYQDVSRFLVENAWFGVMYFLDNVYVTNQDVNAVNQAGSIHPYLRNFSPAE